MKYVVIILIVVVVIAGGVAAWKFDLFSSPGQTNGSGKASHVVKRQTLKIVLTERGTLKAKNSTKIICEAHGKIAQLVDEGKSVKKDDVLVEMDKDDTQNRLEQYENLGALELVGVLSDQALWSLRTSLRDGDDGDEKERKDRIACLRR